ncbi:Phospholipase D active site motif containing protein [Ascosphaera apis ARSEF 7405]|uniref:Phospholipase n=1 Tax=Ascosphaera apis ARSEF 7405 TaxID=392613 RepID=A0A167Y6E5_9EURO|nr:Phospholipase D active site motif containing protein [Ascosphaera apis ARSEF 7405]
MTGDHPIMQMPSLSSPSSSHSVQEQPSSPPADAVQQHQLQQRPSQEHQGQTAVPITTAHPQDDGSNINGNDNGNATVDKDIKDRDNVSPGDNDDNHDLDHDGSNATRSNAIPVSEYLEPPDRSIPLLRKPQSVPSLALSKKQAVAPPDHLNDGSTLSPPLRPASADSANPLSPQRSHSEGISTFPDGQNVQFAPGTLEPPNRHSLSAAHSRSSSFNHLDADDQAKDSRLSTSLFSKLKALAANTSFPTHSRSFSASAAEGGPAESRMVPSNTSVFDEDEEYDDSPPHHGEETDADADAESDSGGPQETRVKRKRRLRRLGADSGGQSTSNISRGPPGLWHTGSFTPGDGMTPTRPTHFRRAVSALTPYHREGVSEDEGRERLKKERRRSQWLQSARGLYGGGNKDGNASADETSTRRPGNLRRLTGFGEGSEGIASSWRRHKGERGTSLGAQRWRQIKAGIKALGQRRKAENTVDQAKSAELLAELASGVPSALLLASMFQRDEHGRRRIPILLEQLKVRVTDSQIDTRTTDRHLDFRIELEYGSGMTRMKWIIHRSLKDFANLHLKYKLQIGTQRYIQLKGQDGANSLPHFPRGAFPYLRGVRGLEDSQDEDEEEEETAGEAASGNDKAKKKRRRTSLALHRRQSSLAAPSEGTPSRPGSISHSKREPYPERQKKKLEVYLQQMIRFLMFRPDSNRLCKFLEISSLGVRLAAEGSYHGKEGFLMIQYSKGLDFRTAWNPKVVKFRHSPKWFLVRHSYIVCVDSPTEMHIYDVLLVDPAFEIQGSKKRRQIAPKENSDSARESASHPKHHTLKIRNSERKLKLLARTERQLHQFEDSIRFMVSNTPWSKSNRFDSFAPVRPNCFAQWLVDGRDYMWVVSRAINQAKDVIYIHDWWVSPELYMRRPAAISQKWRLDRLLQRKAREGVKVFVIMYRNINSAIPIDSEYSKFSLLDLHPNVFVQRSPNQFRQNTFFWAHHEKICVVDHTLAFVGGVDLCFGRWDTPQHSVTDDKLTGFEPSDMPKDADHCQLWPGKDYSNPRVQDFYDLDKPYEEMYDREVVPRMPWHDIAMQVIGQPARDLTRHFVQRWNYILRQRKPTRPTPFLLPPPDFNPEDLKALGLDGTCEVQILRSACQWSLGIDTTEHNALVERIIKAHKNNETWRCVILIPLMPGFQNPVDTEGGTSVRLIMMCQYRSICRGETSIFGRLRAHGIHPEDYIQFFSLRSWGKIGPKKNLVTEQLYIHAKICIVDDRAAIIASANINERSMLGSRDSECGALVRDTDLLWSTMDGKPYLVGRFPHTLRMRLMREHLGVDVDELLEEEMAEAEARGDIDQASQHSAPSHFDEDVRQADRQDEKGMLERRHRAQDEFIARSEEMHSFNHDVDWEQEENPNLKTSKKLTTDARVTKNPSHRNDVEGRGKDQMAAVIEAGEGESRDSYLAPDGSEYLTHPTPGDSEEIERNKAEAANRANEKLAAEANPSQIKTEPDTASATHHQPVHSDYRKYIDAHSPLSPDIKLPLVDKDCMRDPVCDPFYMDIWQTVAENNTKLFRRVFRCMPDSEVKSWKEYKEYTAYAERFVDMQNSSYYNERSRTKHEDTTPPANQEKSPLRPTQGEESQAQETIDPSEEGHPLSDVQAAEKLRSWAAEANKAQMQREKDQLARRGTTELNEKDDSTSRQPTPPRSSNGVEFPVVLSKSDGIATPAETVPPSRGRKRRGNTRGSKHEFRASDDIISVPEAEELLSMVQGHLIQFPYDWLEREEQGGNWLYTLDQISPLEIYD